VPIDLPKQRELKCSGGHVVGYLSFRKLRSKVRAPDTTARIFGAVAVRARQRAAAHRNLRKGSPMELKITRGPGRPQPVSRPIAGARPASLSAAGDTANGHWLAQEYFPRRGGAIMTVPKKPFLAVVDGTTLPPAATPPRQPRKGKRSASDREGTAIAAAYTIEHGAQTDKLHADAFRDLEGRLCDYVRMAHIAGDLAANAEGDEDMIFAIVHTFEMLKKLKADYYAAYHDEKPLEL
jgi:hypothetical protein